MWKSARPNLMTVEFTRTSVWLREIARQLWAVLRATTRTWSSRAVIAASRTWQARRACTRVWWVVAPTWSTITTTTWSWHPNWTSWIQWKQFIVVDKTRRVCYSRKRLFIWSNMSSRSVGSNAVVGYLISCSKRSTFLLKTFLYFKDEEGIYYWHKPTGTVQRRPPVTSRTTSDLKSADLTKNQAATSSVEDNYTLTSSFHSSNSSNTTSTSSIKQLEKPDELAENLHNEFLASTSTSSSSSSSTSSTMEAKSFGPMKQQQQQQQSRLTHSQSSTDHFAKSSSSSSFLRFYVRSLGWIKIDENDLTPERSSKAVNRCINDLSRGVNDFNDAVARWGEVCIAFYLNTIISANNSILKNRAKTCIWICRTICCYWATRSMIKYWTSSRLVRYECGASVEIMEGKIIISLTKKIFHSITKMPFLKIIWKNKINRERFKFSI